MPFTDELFKFPPLLFTTWSSILNTCSLETLVAITHNVFLARSLEAGNSNLWSHHRWKFLYTLALQALCSIEFLAHVTFTCIKSTSEHSVTRTKNFLSHARPAPGTTRVRPANASTRNPCRFTRPSQDSSLHTTVMVLLTLAKLIATTLSSKGTLQPLVFLEWETLVTVTHEYLCFGVNSNGVTDGGRGANISPWQAKCKNRAPT